jgi:hypothetical protein
MHKAKTFSLGILALGVAISTAYSAPEKRPAPRAAVAPRGKDAGARYTGAHVVPHPGQPIHTVNNPPHTVVYHNATTKKDEKHVVVIDHRPAHVIDHDPRIRIVRRGYRSAHHWEHFHPVTGGWFRLWGITAWDTVGTVTCEAANETSGEMYPVSEDRDGTVWDDGTVNAVLDQALDDCMAEAGTAQCAAASPACTFPRY